MRLVKIYSVLIIAALCGAGALHSHASGPGYYEWLDDRGTPQYSERPPLDRPYTFVTTKAGTKTSQRSDSTADKGVTVPGSVDEGLPEIQAQEKNTEFCNRARNNLNTLNGTARVRIRDENGDFRYLSEEEKDIQRQKATNLMAVHC